MKIISTGNTYEVFDNTLKTFDKLPPQVYSVRFSKQKGFYLKKHENITVDEKIYGAIPEKVDKVLRSFEAMSRNLGVILSGDKGMGKSLFAKILTNNAIDNEIPVIIVDEYIPGISHYIESIDQEVMVLFDEFDKTFKTFDNNDSQDELLSLFDGVCGGKKLFVITCNLLYNINSFILNRPGRFHYHFRFEYPNSEEIRRYLKDKIDEQFYPQIDEVVAFSKRVSLNYDCLRAIAFELNNGTSFSSAITDLNIINYGRYEEYELLLHYKDGTVIRLGTRSNITPYSDHTESCAFYKNTYYLGEVKFNTKKVEFVNDSLVILGRHLDIIYLSSPEGLEEGELIKDSREREVDYLELRKRGQDKFHYSL